MKIKVYSSKELQALLGAKTEPVDYLHVVILKNGQFAIYIWDTREAVETGKANIDEAKLQDFKNARDNHKPLVNLAEDMEVNFDELPKVPNFKVFRSDKQIAVYRHGRVLIIENGKVVSATEGVSTMQEFIAARPEFKKSKKDDEVIGAVLDLVKKIKSGANVIEAAKNWYFIPKAKKEAAE